MLTKAPAPRSTRLPNRGAGPGSPVPRHRAPASPRGSNKRPDRQCGDLPRQSRPRRGPSLQSEVPELSPPPIPLTLRAMNRSRRHFHSSRRPALVLFSVLGLLASLCFAPVIHAATVYDPEQTRIPGSPQPGDRDSKNSTPQEEEARAAASGSAGGSGGSQNGSGDGSSAGKSASTGSGEGTRQGSPGNGSSTHDKSSAKNSQDDSAGSAASTSDDGSSPLVPILIAIAALAAISIGVVVARKRRGLGESVSPKAS